MIVYNTRFNPTVNGQLHLGHAYMCLVNMTEAHQTGGKFILRYDDTQPIWNWMFSRDERFQFKEQMQEDLAWLGIDPDIWSSQEDLLDAERDLVVNCFGDKFPEMRFAHLHSPEVIGLGISMCPYTRRFTLDHVALDHLENINLVIRGYDLITEANYYISLCHKWKLNYPRLVYLPRLKFEDEQISKTANKFKICDFRRAGVSPIEVLANLKRDCLKIDSGDWLIDNVKDRPELGAWAKEVMNGFYE